MVFPSKLLVFTVLAPAKASAEIPLRIADTLPFTSETMDSAVASFVTAEILRFFVMSEAPLAVIYFAAAASPLTSTTLDS